MLKKRDSGPKVVALQQALLELGEVLPRYGADGDLGDETLGAVRSLLARHGRSNADDPNANVVDDAELALIESLHQALHATPALEGLVDRRRFTGRNKDRGSRAWTSIKGWCLHQTACLLSHSTNVARCDDIGAHWVVYPDGRKFHLHDADRIIIHGNGWNNSTIGIEIDGLFAGIEGDASTVWDDPSTAKHERAGTVTPEQIEAVKAIIRSEHAELRRHGAAPTLLVAHRQSSSSRRHDPGSKVWQEIALPLMAELGLGDGGAGYKLGQGSPIPVEWDPSRTAYRY